MEEFLDHESTYRYARASLNIMMEDRDFSADALLPGEPLPEFDLPTARGGRFRSRDLVGHSPLLVIMGSITCPMTAASTPALKRLYSEFGDQVSFVTLYVREAHPGEHYPQPQDDDLKLEHAVDLLARDTMRWPIAVDTIDGRVHRALDTKPNAVYLVDRYGKVVYRGLWAGDEQPLVNALSRVAYGLPVDQQESRNRMVPMAEGIGAMHEVLQQAGPSAERDMWTAAPPLALAAWVANAFQPLPNKWRTAAAVGAIGLATGTLLHLMRGRS